MKVVRLSALRTGRLYPQETFLVSTPGTLCSRKYYVIEKNPMIPSGIKPATFRLVAQCLNQLRHLVPPQKSHNHCQMGRLLLLRPYLPPIFIIVLLLPICLMLQTKHLLSRDYHSLTLWPQGEE